MYKRNNWFENCFPTHVCSQHGLMGGDRVTMHAKNYLRLHMCPPQCFGVTEIYTLLCFLS